MTAIPLGLLLLASLYDLRSRTVPDTFSLLMLAWVVIGKLLGFSSLSCVSIIGGLAVAFLLGLLCFAAGGLGGGDVKLTAALGALVGFLEIWPLLFWIATAGGLLSLISWGRGQRDLAYVPAITLGFCLFLGFRGSQWLLG